MGWNNVHLEKKRDDIEQYDCIHEIVGRFLLERLEMQNLQNQVQLTIIQ